MEANGWNPKKKGKGGSGNYKQEKWGPPKPAGELGVCYVNGTPYAYCGKSIMGLNVVGTRPIPQSFTRNGQQKALFLTLLWSAHLMNWS
jgi:hypothetical protein